jgi:phenylalanyl-tRNA synthetase beta chain
MTGQGLYEVVTLPLVSPGDTPSVQLLNPLSAEEGSLRPALLPSLARQAERNWAAGTRAVRLFEVGTVFQPAAPGQRPIEQTRLAGVISGGREPAHWSGVAPDVDLWDLKGLFEQAVAIASPGATVDVVDGAWVARSPGGSEVGRAQPLDADAPPWAAPLFGFEVAVSDAGTERPRFTPLPATPASDRDVTLLVPAGITSAAITSAFAGSGMSVLESVTIVNEYRGPRVAEGSRSVTVRLRFRAPDRTLETAEVEKAETRLLAVLERETGVRRREQAGAGG